MIKFAFFRGHWREASRLQELMPAFGKHRVLNSRRHGARRAAFGERVAGTASWPGAGAAHAKE